MPHAKKTTYIMKTWTLILTFCPLLTFAQQMDNKKLIDSLRFVTEMPYACEILLDKSAPYNRDTLIFNIGCGRPCYMLRDN